MTVDDTARCSAARCCSRAAALWGQDDLMIFALDGRKLPTDVIDQLPPWRARMVVTLCLRAGGRLEHGDENLFEQAVKAAGRHDAGATGWWRHALGMPPLDKPAPPQPAGEYRPPTGWKVANMPTR